MILMRGREYTEKSAVIREPLLSDASVRTERKFV